MGWALNNREIYLVTSMIAINETVRVDLIVFLALFADLATIAVAYDNAHFERRPVEWQLPKIWIISTVLGTLLAVGTWILRGTLWLPQGGVIQNFGSIQGILFLEISLTENWLIFVTRGFNTFPSWQLIGAIFGVDVLSTLFCLFGWFAGGLGEPSTPASMATNLSSNGWTDIVTVVIIWCCKLSLRLEGSVGFQGTRADSLRLRLHCRHYRGSRCLLPHDGVEAPRRSWPQETVCLGHHD